MESMAGMLLEDLLLDRERIFLVSLRHRFVKLSSV